MNTTKGKESDMKNVCIFECNVYRFLFFISSNFDFVNENKWTDADYVTTKSGDYCFHSKRCGVCLCECSIIIESMSATTLICQQFAFSLFSSVSLSRSRHSSTDFSSMHFSPPPSERLFTHEYLSLSTSREINVCRSHNDDSKYE